MVNMNMASISSAPSPVYFLYVMRAFVHLGARITFRIAHPRGQQGLDVANRRSFFLGIRRVVLLAQVLELIVACVWQVMFPYGGVAGFVAGGSAAASPPSSSWAGALGDGQGRLGLAVAVALGQAALYTILLVFFGCDRVVLRAMRLTGWEHGAAAAWTFVRALTVAGQSAKLSYAAVASWLAGVTMLCGYFGRQL